MPGSASRCSTQTKRILSIGLAPKTIENGCYNVSSILLAFNVRNNQPLRTPADRRSRSKVQSRSCARFVPIWPAANYFRVISSPWRTIEMYSLAFSQGRAIAYLMKRNKPIVHVADRPGPMARVRARLYFRMFWTKMSISRKNLETSLMEWMVNIPCKTWSLYL